MSNSCSFEFQQCFKCCYHLALPPLTAIYCLPALVIGVCTGRQRERIRCSVETVLLPLSHLNLINLLASTAQEKNNTFQSVYWKTSLKKHLGLCTNTHPFLDVVWSLVHVLKCIWWPLYRKTSFDEQTTQRGADFSKTAHWNCAELGVAVAAGSSGLLAPINWNSFKCCCSLFLCDTYNTKGKALGTLHLRQDCLTQQGNIVF